MREKERVHRPRDMADLISRLEGNRRAFGLFHPIGDINPLAILYVALTADFPNTIDQIFREASPESPADARHAIFYSISLCEPGATGLGLGQRLIKGALMQLVQYDARLMHFQTLSPIPSLRRWLEACHPGHTSSEREHLTRLYLEGTVENKRRGKMFDPVAAFHLGNGAILDRIVPDANPRYNLPSLFDQFTS